ncbi:MAG: Hsp20/alpha crystallin family protein [Proteobacteria bacterium]|nr:Hsp20/alpha crystallin family protein [Pseudomonadota bacterium]
MSVLRYEPWALRFINNGPGIAADSGAWIPAADIAEETTRYVLQLDLPGVDPAKVEITADQGVLTIRGERDIPRSDTKEGYRRIERLSGQFQRRFTLPETADEQAIQARASQGVLEVVIPKVAQVQPRRIEVRAA